MNRSRGVVLRFASIVAATTLVGVLSQAADQKITDGNYGHVGNYKQWTVTLESAEWGQTFRFNLELLPNGLHAYQIENSKQDGTAKEQYKTDWTLEATRDSESIVRFVVPISKLPRPKAGQPVHKPGQTQLVVIELVADGQQVLARALPPDRTLCPDCASWSVSNYTHI